MTVGLKSEIGARLGKLSVELGIAKFENPSARFAYQVFVPCLADCDLVVRLLVKPEPSQHAGLNHEIQRPVDRRQCDGTILGSQPGPEIPGGEVAVHGAGRARDALASGGDVEPAMSQIAEKGHDGVVRTHGKGL